MQEIDDLTNPTSASLGPLNRHTASIKLYTASNSANINNLLGLTSSIPYLNSLTSSYVTSPEIANVISSSLQISDLGFIKELPLDIISSSAQITALGFVSSSVSLLNFSGSFASASLLLNANRQFLRKEIAAYTSNQNNLSETPFTFVSDYFEQNTLDDVDAIKYDIANKIIYILIFFIYIYFIWEE